jgi:hypothetical protein
MKQDLTMRASAKAISRNMSLAAPQLAARGCGTGGSPPFGYRIAGAKRERGLVPGPAAEVAVKELFQIAAEGRLASAALARPANERGRPVP